MSAPILRRALQGILFLLGAVALVAGLYTVATGSAGMPGNSEATANVESELRFYSVFWSAFGVFALIAARDPERWRKLIHLLAAFLFLGGVARGFGWIATSRPDTQFLVLMGLELALPLLMVGLSARLRMRHTAERAVSEAPR